MASGEDDSLAAQLRRRRPISPHANGGTKPLLASPSDDIELDGVESHLDGGNDVVATRPTSRISELWMRSRLVDPNPSRRSATPPSLRGQGEDRPLTSENMRIAVELVGLLWWRFLSIFAGHKWRMGWYLLSRVIKGFLPACRNWSASLMLDLVQRSFEEEVDTTHVIRLALFTLLFSASEDIFRFVSQHNDDVIKSHLDHTMEKAYLGAQLSLSIPALSSPYLCALMYEAGVFAGFETRVNWQGPRGTSGGPYQTLQSLFSLVTLSVEVASHLMLLLRTLTSTTTELNWSTALLIVLSLAPTGLNLLGSYLSTRSGMGRSGRPMKWASARSEEQYMKQLGRNGGYKQEVVFFGLKDWILEKWDKVYQKQVDERDSRKQHMGLLHLGLGLGQESVQTGFYVLLALRVLSTKLSLGSIRLYQNTAGSLIGSVRRFTDILASAFQSVFYLAAFCEAVDRPVDTTGTDYEVYRGDGGMAIEAVDLSFTYPGSSKPTLHGINLSLKPGETLAIVGFNGGGKTTLVKVLMGLYDHDGELRINGIEAKEYNPASLHARTSCLFQDFAKYNFTFRENVGVGDVEKMGKNEEIEWAVKRGGAEGVLSKVGMEGQLNRQGVPQKLDLGPGGGGAGDDGFTNEEPELPPMPFPPPDGMPPPGMMRGGGPGGKGGRGGRGGHGGPPGPPGMNGSLAPSIGGGRMPFPPPFPPPGFGKKDKEKDKDDRAALSGGQWQRVALSRAFLRADHADLVVFDEPSASLDPKAEAELFQRIHALSQRDGGHRSTTIYISHRFSTVRRADQIAFVENGTVVEIGTHEKLMAIQGRYFELFTLQREGFEE